MMHEISVSALAPVIGLLVATAITPGPNNVIVMEAGARGGSAAAAAILGVSAGTVVLLVLAWSGVGAIVETAPGLKLALSTVGGAYLIWLGFGIASTKSESSSRAGALPASVPAIAVFQLLNPKAWILVITVTAALPGVGLVGITALILVVTSTCLAIWAGAGAATSRFLDRPGVRQVFNRVMGSVLALSAAGMVTHALIE
jgi:threonine/homoserine/homoserine lactone efflux protein